MFDRFKKRSYELERLDTGDYSSAEYLRWQKEMYFIHRIFGEMRALKGTLFRDIQNDGSSSISILDVGAGSGQLLKELAKWIGDGGTFAVGIEIDDVATRSIKDDRTNAVQADALKLPFKENSFDYVFCSLFLHHLSDENARQLLKEMARVAAKRIYVIDLNRHPAAYYFYKVIGGIFLQKFTLEDGALSILRSFSYDELSELAESVGLTEIKVERSKVNRLILSACKK